MHRHTPFAVSLLLAASAAIAQNPPATPDIAADLKHKQYDKRTAAIDAIAASDRKDADALLLPLLRENDLEIQEHAARAMGKRKTKAAMPALLDLAVDGDVVRVRQAAALAINAIDPVDGAAKLWKQAKGKSAGLALEALAIVLRGQKFTEADKLKKLLRDPSAAIREPAAVAWLEGAADRPAAVKELLNEPFLVVRCRALEAIEQAPRAEDLEPLTFALSGAGQNDVVGRRLLRAMNAVLRLGEGDHAALAKAVLDKLGEDALVLTRRARMVPLLTRGTPPVFDQKQAVAALQSPLKSKDGAARSAAAHALREVGGEAALALALEHFPKEPDPRVQLQLVETVTALRKVTTPEATEWLIRIVRGNHDDSVKERAIVRLGKSGVKDATDALVGALGTSNWTLGCCAAVSLGKTDDDKALEPLQRLLLHTDWRKRGAAVIGLMHWSREAAIEPLLGALADQHPIVARAAHEALSTIARRYEAKQDVKSWKAWWETARGKHDFTDREASIDKLKKYGYAVPDTEIYAGLDVLVFKSRGDHIEQLLERLKITHRSTEQAQVLTSGVHPEAIFVSNCTGELAPPDVEPLQWFVCTGGSLFGSCWALTETIGRIHPGVMQQAVAKDQVMDDVRAQPCREGSPLLTGVFPPSVVPVYHLEGAHLIAVNDPERCEVLIDSPDAAERWGYGNLAAWFFSGHGVLFDSANHFDLQGLASVVGMKTDKDRQAYAIDHMGMTYDTWRTTKGAAHWKSPTQASKVVPDLSAFRLLTNFVRSKRIGDY